MFGYRGYFVFLNTIETNGIGAPVIHQNRARWTYQGTPYYSNPVPTNQAADVTCMRDDIFGGAAFSDAATSESIIGAEFVRDVLIVYFTKSTWRLRYQQGGLAAFVWERVNRDFGSSSTFSTIVFDKGIMAIGTRGIIMSDGNDTRRIDKKIPDQIFDISTAADGLKRVAGIRTYETRLNFWTMPISPSSGIFPNRTLVYNYEEDTWALFAESFTCFGYFLTSNSNTWNSLTAPWSSYKNKSWEPLNNQAQAETLIAGKAQGIILNIEENEINDFA